MDAPSQSFRWGLHTDAPKCTRTSIPKAWQPDLAGCPSEKRGICSEPWQEMEGNDKKVLEPHEPIILDALKAQDCWRYTGALHQWSSSLWIFCSCFLALSYLHFVSEWFWGASTDHPLRSCVQRHTESYKHPGSGFPSYASMSSDIWFCWDFSFCDILVDFMGLASKLLSQSLNLYEIMW